MMFARLVTVQFQIERIDEVIKMFEEEVIPVGKSWKGYRQSYFLGNRSTGECVAFTLWDSEEDIVANDQSSSYQELLGKVAPLITSAPVREVYEVIIQDSLS
jgi:heme-degrading monooxygenase HmoA